MTRKHLTFSLVFQRNLASIVALERGNDIYPLRRVVRFIQDALITKLGGKIFSSPPRSFFILRA